MKSSTEIDILKTALELALEWGEHWLQPVQSRLAKQYPQLSREALDNYNDIVQTVMRFGWEAIKEFDFMNDTASSEKYKAKLLAGYPWMTEANLSRLYSQSCYYAMK